MENKFEASSAVEKSYQVIIGDIMFTLKTYKEVMDLLDASNAHTAIVTTTETAVYERKSQPEWETTRKWLKSRGCSGCKYHEMVSYDVDCIREICTADPNNPEVIENSKTACALYTELIY